MAIAGFSPEEFAKSLTEQAKEVLPADLPQKEKEFVANILYRYCMLAGDALSKDDTCTLNAQQASIITQFIGEWSFHKSIDLIRSGIPMEKRDPILQKVAFAVFEESRDVILNNVEQNEAITRVENAVAMAYQESLDEMKRQNQLDEELASKAMQESNIDKMAQDVSESQPQQPQQKTQNANQASDVSDKLLRLAAISLLLKKMNQKNVNAILSKFGEKDRKAIMSYMQVEGLEEAFDMKKLKSYMHDFLLTIPQEAQAYNEKQTRQKYTELTKSAPQEKLEEILKTERSKVKDSLENSKKVKEMPSKVSSIVFDYLKEKIST